MINYRIKVPHAMSTTEFRDIIKKIVDLSKDILVVERKYKSQRVDPIYIKKAVKIAESYGYTLTELVSLIYDKENR
jgi:hypothetical protein